MKWKRRPPGNEKTSRLIVAPAALSLAELAISRAVVDETPVEYAPVKGLASSYVDDIELDVVDDESPVLPEHCVPQDRSQRP